MKFRRALRRVARMQDQLLLDNPPPPPTLPAPSARWRGLRRTLYAAAGFAAVCAATWAVFARLHQDAGQRPTAVHTRSAAQTIVLDGGSRLRLAPYSTARIRASGSETAIDLRTGYVDAEIRTPSTVLCGPYAVSTSGARFRMGRRAPTAPFSIRVRSGRVRVRGPLVEQGMTVYAANRLLAWPRHKRLELHHLETKPARRRPDSRR